MKIVICNATNVPEAIANAPGTTSDAQVEIKRLKKQIIELEKANEILRSASAFFATARGTTEAE